MMGSFLQSPHPEAARAWMHALVDRLAFVVESACVANAVFWFLTWGMLGFRWLTAAHEWANFWAHYVAAAPIARRPVEVFVGAVLLILTVLAGAIRAPKASRAWHPWPHRPQKEANL